MAKIKDPKTNEEREETEAEIKAREAAAEEEPEEDPKKAAAKWKALAIKHEARAKENADAAKRLKEFEDKDKGEVQRLTEAHKAAEERATTAERDALRSRIALRKGLTEAQAKRLQGDTEDDMDKDADELLTSFTAKKDDTTTTRTPRERLRSGSQPAAEPESDPSKVADKILSGRVFG